MRQLVMPFDACCAVAVPLAEKRLVAAPGLQQTNKASRGGGAGRGRGRSIRGGAGGNPGSGGRGGGRPQRGGGSLTAKGQPDGKRTQTAKAAKAAKEKADTSPPSNGRAMKPMKAASERKPVKRELTPPRPKSTAQRVTAAAKRSTWQSLS